jgi:hypothetical protein
MKSSINPLELASELAHLRVLAESKDLINEIDMYVQDTEGVLIYKDDIQDRFNIWYDFYLDHITEATKPSLPYSHIVEFEYEGKAFTFEIGISSEDEWFGVTQHDMTFDIHYCEDYNEVSVYLVKDGKADYSDTIHSQPLIP